MSKHIPLKMQPFYRQLKITKIIQIKLIISKPLKPVIPINLQKEAIIYLRKEINKSTFRIH